MHFNDTFIIRGPIRCDSGLRRRSGPFPWLEHCCNTIPSAFQPSPSKEKLLLLHRPVRRCTCARPRHGHPGAQSHGSLAFTFSGSGYSMMPFHLWRIQQSPPSSYAPGSGAHALCKRLTSIRSVSPRIRAFIIAGGASCLGTIKVYELVYRDFMKNWV